MLDAPIEKTIEYYIYYTPGTSWYRSEIFQEYDNRGRVPLAIETIWDSFREDYRILVLIKLSSRFFRQEDKPETLNKKRKKLSIYSKTNFKGICFE